jgi:hypothetical protein
LDAWGDERFVAIEVLQEGKKKAKKATKMEEKTLI